MIRVDVQLESAVSEDRNERLCQVVIANDGTGTGSLGNYDVRLYARGENGRLIRQARVEGYPRRVHPAWRLIAAAMRALEEA